MAHNPNTTPHRVFKISELTRQVAAKLIETSQKSAVDLACASPDLEQSVLSVLWVEQQSLCTLLEALPQVVLDRTDGSKKCQVRWPNLCSEVSNASARVVVFPAQDRGGSPATGLDQSPALFILDVRRHC